MIEKEKKNPHKYGVLARIDVLAATWVGSYWFYAYVREGV